MRLVAAWMAILALTMGWAGHATAQELFVAGGPGGPTHHAWMIVPAPGGNDATILHFFPRRKGEAPDIGTPARRAGVIDGLPQLAAAGGNRLFVACRGSVGNRRIWRVFSMRAMQAPIGEAWVTHPADGYDVHPPLDTTTRPLDLAVSALGACVLTHDGNVMTLVALLDARWVPLELPEGLARASTGERDGLRMLGTGDGLLMLMVDTTTGTIRAWFSRVTRESLSLLDSERNREGLAPMSWDSLDATWQTPPVDTQHAEIRACVAGDRVALASRDGEGVLWIHTATLGGASLVFSPLASIDGVDAAFGITGLDDRLLIAQLIESPPERGVRVREVDLASGVVIYDGPPRLGMPLGRPEYLLLAAILLQLTACALVFILKPEREDAIWLPEGYAMAPGFRRVLAGALDASLVLGIVERFWIALAPAILGENDTPVMRGLALALSAMALLVLQGTILEAFFGRTLGKFVASICIIAPCTRPGDSHVEAMRPSFGQAFLRNLVKWGLPPLGLLGLLDRDGRNRGDQLSGTICALRLEADDERPTDDDEPE